jgi:hypothetical protein
MVFGVVGFTMLSLSAPDELPALTEQIGWWGAV